MFKLQEIRDLLRNACFTVLSGILYKVVQQTVQLKNANASLFVGKPTERLFV